MSVKMTHFPAKRQGRLRQKQSIGSSHAKITSLSICLNFIWYLVNYFEINRVTLAEHSGFYTVLSDDVKDMKQIRKCFIVRIIYISFNN